MSINPEERAKWTSQQVFDYVAAHLRKQRVAATNSDGSCMYRGRNGTSCAVGCLIADEEYSKTFEHTNARDLSSNTDCPSPLSSFLDKHSALLAVLQQTHDSKNGLHGTGQRLISDAREFHLEFDFDTWIGEEGQ